MTPIRLSHVKKRLGSTLAVDDVELEIKAGELFFLLGPSGCGKTTLLNLVAGLLEPDAGSIWFGERDVTRLRTSARSAVMCFQSYALWPHLSVAQNVSFGLEVRKLSRAERNERVRQALELVHMSEYLERKPAELSGGQQQRVAIARAIAVRPECLLLDEPLSNLDPQLRQQMRSEIRRICRATGLTTLYVTHDQKEALSIADRIAILERGRVVQVGPPEQLYTRPETPFVAEFLGHSNLIAGRVLERAAADPQPDAAAPGGDGRQRWYIDTALGKLWAFAKPGLVGAGANVTLAIRPEQLRIAPTSRQAPAAQSVNCVPACVLESWFLGDRSEHRLSAGGRELRMQSVPPTLHVPEQVVLELPADDLVVLAHRLEAA